MMRRLRFKLKDRVSVVTSTAAVLLIALIGYTFMNMTGAASFVTTVEAENGSIAGRAAVVDHTGASRGKSVKFGTSSCSPHGNNQLGTTPQCPKWPGVDFQAGAQHIITPAQVDIATAMGITLNMAYPIDRNSPLAARMREKGMRYLDRNISDIIYAACGPGVPVGSCNPSASQQTAVLNEVRAYLNSSKDDPSIAGYYILDDYPGDVKTLLQSVTQEVHRVHQSNPKPTVCAFVSTLDFRQSPGAPLIPAHSGFDQAIRNYTPQGCDIPDFYSYGVGHTVNGCHPTSLVDWTGAGLMPYMKQVLQTKGWNPADGFMISPQTFDFGEVSCSQQLYNTPTAATIQAQTASFCRGGAVSTLAYIWTNPANDPVERGLQQVASWRDGYRLGIEECKRSWASR